MSLSAAVEKKARMWRIGTVLLMIALILITRFAALFHNMYLHPDEPVFFESATSVFNADTGYAAVKSYPEGAFFLFMPFQLLGRWIGQWTGAEWEPRVIGRVASVFFFTMGCVLGCATLSRAFPKRKLTLPAYALTMAFSLFQIEQSRYGTGDPMSFFLLSLVVYLLALYLKKPGAHLLGLASFAVGVLGAVKYPQVFFLCLPLCAARLKARESHTSWWKAGVFTLLVGLGGFLLFSPSLWSVKGFFDGLYTREMAAWTKNTGEGAKSPLWHLICLILYHNVYSDFPLAMPIAVFAVVSLWRNRESDNAEGLFFARALPMALAVFFAYNLFVPGIAFRTYYLFFSMAALYTAYGVGRLWEKLRWRPVAALLACLMVARGAMLVSIMANDSETVTDKLARQDLWVNDEMTIAAVDYCPGGPPFNAQCYKPEDFLRQEPEIEYGEFVFVTSYDHHWSDSPLYLACTGQEPDQVVQDWKFFQEENDIYWFDQMYPDFYSDLFGFWVYGSTAGQFEFPQIHFYCSI